MSDTPPPLPLAPMPFRLKPRADVFPLTEEREVELRARIIAEALSWVGTPYRQLGATKGVAVDCSMLLVRAMIDAGIVEEFDPRPYPPAWFLHREDERYIDWLAAVAVEVDTPKPGDIIAMKMGRAFAHSGFIVDAEHVVHAFAAEQICNVSPLHHPNIMWFDRRGTIPRPKRYFDYFARLRLDAAT
jgi:cell wall-associated NlpC family hydrolase